MQRNSCHKLTCFGELDCLTKMVSKLSFGGLLVISRLYFKATVGSLEDGKVELFSLMIFTGFPVLSTLSTIFASRNPSTLETP